MSGITGCRNLDLSCIVIFVSW